MLERDLRKSRACGSDHARREIKANQVAVACREQLSQTTTVPTTKVENMARARQPLAYSLDIDRMSEWFLRAFAVPIFILTIQIDQVLTSQDFKL